MKLTIMFLSPQVKMDLHDKEILPGKPLPVVIIGEKHTLLLCFVIVVMQKGEAA